MYIQLLRNGVDKVDEKSLHLCEKIHLKKGVLWEEKQIKYLVPP